ncbi:MAG TPA: glycosyltransferase family 4 protein [Candidatus Methylomirabilis sp.]|nr:glycosyltransferase family 4 protein [Candidatus Methylomirabilis sp.]
MTTSAGRVLMFVEHAYPNDTRVRNEAETLTEAGYSVTVVALRETGQPRSEIVRGVRTYRLPRLQLFQKIPGKRPSLLRRVWLKGTSVLGYLSEYVYFTGACFLMSVYVGCTRGFDVIHAHNPPDTLWAVAWPWRLLGKRYVYDHHDLCPELYRSRYGARQDVVATVLLWVERVNLALADVTIATNESYKAIQMGRGGRRPETVFVVRNGPNRDRMRVRAASARLRDLGKTILVYVGSLNPQDGVDYLLRALRHLVYDIGRDDVHCVIVGDGDSLESLRRLTHELKLEGFVELTGYVPDAELEETLAAADICVDPDPSSPLNDVSTWIKIMEYMAYAKPIVAFDLKETRYSAQDAAVFVRCNDEMAFAHAVARLMDDRALCERMGRFGRERVERELQWSVVGKNLLAAYASLKLRR